MNQADAYTWSAGRSSSTCLFDIEGVELDFQVLDPDGTGLQMDVLLVAAKRELVENQAQTSSVRPGSGRRPSVDVDAFALHNAFELNYPAEQEGVTALHQHRHESRT